MNEKRKCLVGHDDDDGAGWLIGAIIVIIVVLTIIALMVCGGIFIGFFHSVKNYLVSLKHNIIDSNFKPAVVN